MINSFFYGQINETSFGNISLGNFLEGECSGVTYLGRSYFATVTRERIRQIEAKALRKLKHPSRGRKLRSVLDN
jgi:hypothetical protein